MFVCGFRTDLHFADAVSNCCTKCMLYQVYAVLGVCCAWCKLCLVYAVLSICYTRCMLYMVLSLDHWMERSRGKTSLCVHRWWQS